tara:strand:+ start:369 stop:668 length:300 start_codon:yes stop_codon:yes gene_type:complete
MRRYSTTRTKRDKSGVSVYRTTLYPEMPIENGDQFIHSTVGDRIDSLASKYYGDTTLWWIIAKANGIKGKIAIPPATLLRIPSDVEKIVQRFIELNQRG